jgi:TonB family protein
MGALSALSGPTMPSAAAAATTNLDAAVNAHTSGGFKVSGVIGKMPGGELALSSVGGTGRINTKSANEVGQKVGRVSGSGGTGQVRAVVSEPPARSVQVQGELDRNEIAKVVNAHLAEVQGCYERQLYKDPTINGKVLCEWVIDPSGSVSTQRVKTSTVRNSEVASCILASIRNWKFPKPRGGSVTVTYPFVFSTIGM